MSPISNNRQAVLNALRAHYRMYGTPATIEYIKQNTNITTNSVVTFHIEALEKKGLVKLTGHPGSHRKAVPIEIYKQLTGNTEQ